MYPNRARMLKAVLLAAAMVVFVALPAQAATFLVSSTLDAVDASPGDGSCVSTSGGCTLRAAIQEANALAGADEVRLESATYALTIAGALEGAAATGDLDIIRDLTITGAGARSTVIDGGDLDRVLDVDDGAIVSVADLTVRNGLLTGLNFGGGIRNNAILTLDRVAVSGNSAGAGGGIYNQIGGGKSLTIRDSAVTGNQTTFTDGGGILSQATMTITNSTVSGNAATPTNHGGGIYVGGNTTITNLTIAGNSADPGRGPGIAVGPGSTVTITNSIFANGTVNNCEVSVGTLTSGGSNLVEGTCGAWGAGTGDTINTNPQIGGLADNGGQTDTHALQSTSPAIDQASASACPATDQRGGKRPFPTGGSCDIGAFEAGSLADVAIAKTSSPSSLEAGGNLTYTLTVTNNGPDEATGIQAQDTLPSGPAFGSATTSQGSCTGQVTVSCSIGTLAKGASAQITIAVVPIVGATLTNAATASALPTDPAATNNSASATTAVQVALGSLKVKPTAFRPYRGRGASVAAKRGARVRYQLLEDASVTFGVERLVKGRLVKGKCRADSRKRRKRKRCTRVVAMKGSFKHVGKAGGNSFRFTGRLARKPLRKGKYRLVGMASAAAGNSEQERGRFRIR